MENENIKVGESIKLVKNTKGYGWEIRLNAPDPDQDAIIKDDLDIAWIKRLERIDNELRERFGSGTE